MNQENIPNVVFHYTKREIALEKILFEKKIKLGQIGFTNDPRESKERLFSLSYSIPPSGVRLPTNRVIKILNDANKLVKNEWKVFCVSQHHPEEKIHKDESIYTFFRGDCRPRMWAAYAENHKGICLKFDGNKLDKRIRKDLGKQHKIFCGNVK